MSNQGMLLAGCSAAVLLALAGGAHAAEPDPVATAPDAVDEIVVRARDKAGLIEKEPNNTVFGLDKPLIETPRSASFVSGLTLQRYGIESIDGLTAVSPGTYTASFYGVPGALNIRGTLAENYFRGFKRIENRGTYATPIGAADQIQIVRGPPTPIYGSGKVGGMLNFIPKSGKGEGGYLSEPVGEVTATYGSYNRKNATAQIGLPVNLGEVVGGVHVYGEVEDSHSYYKGIYPRRQTLQASSDFDLGNGWSTALGGMVYRSKGDVQTPGWNRLTQDLIDNGTYITGRDTSLVDADGNGRLTPSEIGFYPYASAMYLAYYGFPTTDAKHTLDTGVGTTKLSPRTVYISGADFSKTQTNTLYFDVAKELSPDSSIKLQLFYDALENKRFVSYGYPAWFDSDVWEARLTWNFANEAFDGLVKAKSFVGASYRSFDGRRRESYNSGLIALDRRDIAFGATPTDLIGSPFNPGDGVQWENDNRSEWSQAGLFFTTDIMVGEKLNLMLGGRYDDYDVTSHDTGFLSYTVAGEQKASKGKGTYTASATYKAPLGLMPYITYAKASALEMSQAGDIAPGLVADAGDAWLSDGDLAEAGVKFQWLQGTLVGSLAGYRQNRTQLTGITQTPTGTRAKGVELEVRWLASEHFSFTFSGNTQHTTVKGPDTSFQYVPVHTVGVTGANGFGGSYVVWSFDSVRPGDYDYTLIPKSVLSLYGAYTSDAYDWGKVAATLGVTRVTKTSGTVPGAVVYPDYAVASGSVAYEYGPYTATLNVDNLLDKLYFTPVGDTYANLAALPSKGREWRVTLSRKF
ncbi:TonB-dependent siderophore receptor [Caulobacter endophyticus]|uniref:TonB-dependent siderophore receptor n=1 Tax=Caulobacter endophyticus TaxID=2172652 RepID=UPI00240EAC14|nr:TonB-dependent receptor [Caulobacter endophyticus]MDG2528428.1 TonB-dependent receptor [Caulobacter endophyticus]